MATGGATWLNVTTDSTTGAASVNHITMATGGTGFATPMVQVGGGGGGGSGSGQVYTTSGLGTASWSDMQQNTKLTISGDGDIYRGTNHKKQAGLFTRLERLERMLGILHRDETLEAQWEPLRDIGDAYDAICDDAIRRISEVVAGELKVLQDQYEDCKTQARVYIKLSKED